jgi:hypothetical protein
MRPIEWIENSATGFFHAYAYSDSAIIMGFPQKEPLMWDTFGALIILRKPIGVEPKCVALEARKGTFKIVKEYVIAEEDSDVYDYAYQALTVALPCVLDEWDEWIPFLRDLTLDAILEGAKEGKTMFHLSNCEGFDA